MPESLARVRVVLVRTSHPGNLGAAARAMKTMGLRGADEDDADAGERFGHAC